MHTKYNRVKENQQRKRMCRQALKLWLPVFAELTSSVELIENKQEASLNF